MHVYGSLAEMNDQLRDSGSSSFASEATAISSRKLAILEAASRTIDRYCQRSIFGSGFGPRTGTNRYSGNGRAYLNLEDDLLSVTTLTTKAALGSAGVTYTEEDDFIAEPFDKLPKRRLYGYGSTGSLVFTRGLRTIEIAGSWGYIDERDTATATASVISSTTTTSVTGSAGDEFSPGQTLLIDDEQLYVSGVSGTTLTVVRGANGTTAATHAAAAAIDIYQYPPDVHLACLELAVLRWKQRNAGSDGSDGGGDVPAQRVGSEKSILTTRLRDLRFEFVA